MSAPQSESPTVIRDRAVAVAVYLLAVRAHMERPARVVPADAYRLDALPAHPACEVGPAADGSGWLRVGLPELPGPVAVPAELRRRLTEISPADEPKADGPDFETWRETVWRPWSVASAEAERVRVLHRQLFDLMHQVDMAAATTELVWGHGLLETVVAGHRVRYPLVATPVLIGYDPDRSLITVSPQGPSRLQTDALAGLDERYLGQLLALAGPAGTLEVDLWDDLERRELYERALGRLGYDRRVIAPGETATGPHLVDTGVLFARPRQRQLRGFLESLRDRLLAGDTAAVGALAAIVAHEPSKLRMPDDRPEAWRRVGERLLMPLPTNEAQESIARRLALHRNVAVQGPPGHRQDPHHPQPHLPPDGQRQAGAGRGPEGGPAAGAARRPAGRGGRRSAWPCWAAPRTSSCSCSWPRGSCPTGRPPWTSPPRRPGSSGSPAGSRTPSGSLRRRWAGCARSRRTRAATYRIDDVRLSPADVGAWLRERAAAHGGIPDPVTPAERPPLSADEFATLVQLAARITPADRVAALRPLPEVAAPARRGDREKRAGRAGVGRRPRRPPGAGRGRHRCGTRTGPQPPAAAAGGAEGRGRVAAPARGHVDRPARPPGGRPALGPGMDGSRDGDR
ncbi:hypothetical protein GCM10020358_19980 [Amorphoplanes nipponensis]|uniref:hypothetical protein n=1 Tax=Actinoplanes nipponensis TaxID=135950 RepID=UPI0031E73508